MNDGEWAAIAVMLETWWPGEWTTQKSEGYRLALDRFPARTVAGELERRLDAGDQFRPSAAALVAGIKGDSTQRTSTPDEAWALIEQAIHRVGRSVYAEDFAEHHQAAIDWLAEQDPVVAAFAARRGLVGNGSLGHEPVGDPEHGGAVRGRIAKEYREHAEQAQDRLARGLPAVEPHMLVVRSTSQTGGGMAEVLDALRPEEPPKALGAGE